MKKIIYPELVGEMAKHGETQKTLAALLEITDATISKRFAGTTEWSISEIEKLCKHYEKNYYELFKKNND